MKEYQSTAKEFNVNGKTFKMKKFTLGLQADMEDENIAVTYRDVLEVCTDMSDEDIRSLHDDQLIALYEDIRLFTHDAEQSGDGEPKKP